MIVDLTRGELAVLAMDLGHSPDCAWSQGCVAFVMDENGSEWTDETCTVPHVEQPCTCGYFALLESAKAKLRAVIP